jgi:protein-disulfide isomerase
MNNKNLPILIIVLVLVAAVIGGVAYFRTQKGGTGGTPTPTPKNAAADFKALLDKAPPGAQPPWSKGDPAAKVAIEEFADFSCPTCGQFHQTLKEIEKSYGARVKITFRHFPLQIKGHENSYDAARAAEAAGQQGRFWEMQNMLFTNQKTWTVLSEADARKTFADYAKSIGIDVERFKTDMIGQMASARVADDVKRGQAINLSSTPTVILNSSRPLTVNELNLEVLRQAIENEMLKSQAPTTNQPAANAPNSANQNTP